MNAASDLYDLARGNDPARPYWNPERETMAAEPMAALQLQKLKAQLLYLERNSVFYQAKFKAAGFVPQDLRTIADLAALPFTTKDELRSSQDAAPPFGQTALLLLILVDRPGRIRADVAAIRSAAL